MITKTDIQKLASLARIDISPEEAESLTVEIDAILGYVGQIQNISAEEVKEVPALRNVMRDDVVTHTSGEFSEDILKLVPQREGNYLKVKKILK